MQAAGDAATAGAAVWRGARLALLILAAVLAGACAPSGQPPALPASSPSAPDLAGWQVLYARPGWEGGPAADLRVVGDVMLGRHVAEAAARRGPAYPFAAAAGLLAGDLTIANLESPITGRRDGARPGPYRLIAPPEMAPALAAAGVDVAGLANNHGLDAGPAGLADSLAALRAAGVAPAGAGADGATARAPAILEVAGLRVAVLAFNDVADPADGPAALALRGDRAWRSPDFARCEPAAVACPAGRAWLDAAALDAVAAARAAADVVVVLAHWGAEYTTEPSARQRAWASDLIAAGADLVAGAHPHVLQPAEAVSAGGRRGFVAYSLGNFIFDAPDDPSLSSGAVLRALVDREGVALVAVAPVATAGGRPRPLDLADAAGLAALERLSPQRSGQRAQESGAPAAAPLSTPIAASGAVASGSAEPALPPGSPSSQPGARPRPPGPAAWRWDGAEGVPVAPPSVAPPAAPSVVPADLRGDGEPVWATLDAAGIVTVRDGPGPDAPLLWRNEDPAWRFTRIAAGDPNDDGRVELALLLWQRDAEGRPRSQPYLLGWRGGRYRIIWGGSATTTPIQDFALADLDADGRGELVVLEGGGAPGEPGEHVSVWRWHGWGFQLEWRSPPGTWSRLALADVDGDGSAEIVAVP